MNLNEQQRQAVVNSYDTDVALSAIPGSGKTRTMIERIIYILKNNMATEEELMCITFTKKSATEMMDRLLKENVDISKMAIGTFHSVLQKMLRKYSSHIGIKPDFEIIDWYSQYKIIANILSRYSIPFDKNYIKDILSTISSWKNNLTSSSIAIDNAKDNEEILMAKLYHNYNLHCIKNGLVDFDDILMYSYVLLKSSDMVREIMQNRYKFIMVDEYQDSNTCQVRILQCLKCDTNNIMAIGDPDQSIYSFRDAKPICMTEFDKFFPGSKVMKLEKNYRSTKTIVNASHALIKHNKQRIDSDPKTDNPVGEKIKIFNFNNEDEEANYIANQISFKVKSGVNKYSNYAVIYRINAMSNALEKAFRQYNIPFVISGSVGFYDRKEIRDILCFLKLLVNPRSEDHFTRCIQQIPSVGDKTIKKMVSECVNNNIDYISALPHFTNHKSGAYIREIYNILTINSGVEDIMVRICSLFAYEKKYANDRDSDRMQNVLELIATARNNNMLSVQEFLDNIVLEKADMNEDTECVKLMSMHSAKGLEFDSVYLIGMNEGYLPFYLAKDIDSMEEERRLAYVGVTRAKNNLIITTSKERRGKGSEPSRFLSEIPKQYIDTKIIH